MKTQILDRVVRVLTIATFVLVIGACGKSSTPPNDNNPVNGTTGGTTTGTTTGTTGTQQLVNVDLYTSLCDSAHTTCPDNRQPYRTKVKLEQWLPNGWQFIVNVDTQIYGHVIVQIPAGKYRFSPADPDAGTTATTTAASQILTIKTGDAPVVELDYAPVP